MFRHWHKFCVLYFVASVFTFYSEERSQAFNTYWQINPNLFINFGHGYKCYDTTDQKLLEKRQVYAEVVLCVVS